MSLKEMLFNDLKQAMKDKDTARKEIVQMVRAGVLQIEKDQKTEADDSVVTDVITKEIKKLTDVIPDFERGGRDDLVSEANKKIEILKAYLPEQLSEEEIKDIVLSAVKETGAASPKDMGKVMGAVTARTKGRADNRLVSQTVREILQKL